MQVTLDARNEIVWMRFDALRIDALKQLISATFGVPLETQFTFKYKGSCFVVQFIISFFPLN
jgi:hypothetical protein